MNIFRINLYFYLCLVFVVFHGSGQRIDDTSVICSCPSNKIVVKDVNVKLSNVLSISCIENVNYIEVFAIKKLIIDADIDRTGQNVQISFIAPIWKVIGDRKIILDGGPGKPYSSNASNGIGEFKHGKPGKPGGSGGCFLGIANEFINGERLEIHINGGGGGPGQNGGRGSDGINGTDPPIPNNSEAAEIVWKKPKFHYDITVNTSNIHNGIKYSFLGFKVWGLSGARPGDGGNGGVGGLGGYPGTYFVADLEQSSNFRIFNKAGSDGAIGKGGSSGRVSRYGQVIDIFYKNQYNETTGEIKELGSPSASSIEAVSTHLFGEKGVDGSNNFGIKYPTTVKMFEAAQTVNAFKKFAMDHLLDSRSSRNNEHLIPFLQNIYEDRRIQTLYDTFSSIEELKGLEDQYFRFKENTHFIPVLESLLSRSEKHGTELSHLVGSEKLRSMITNRLIDSRNYEDRTIVSLSESLEEWQTETIQFRSIEKDLLEFEHLNEQINVLDKEIKMLIEDIEYRIRPEIDKIFLEINIQTSELNEELVARQNNYKFVNVDVNIPDFLSNLSNIPPLPGNLKTSMYQNFSTLTGMKDPVKFAYKLIESLKNGFGQINLDSGSYLKANDESSIQDEKFRRTFRMNENALSFQSVRENIYEKIFGRFQEMERVVNTIMEKLSSESDVELNTSKRRAQSAIRDSRAFFLKVSNETSVNEILKRSFDKLDENMAILTDAYKYRNLKNEEKSSIKFEKPLNNAYLGLTRAIKRNQVLEHYKITIHAFKHHLFPFYPLFITHSGITTKLEWYDNEPDIQAALDHVDYLREKTKFLDSSINKYNHLLFKDIDFSSNESSLFGPFFIWKYDTFKAEIMKLLKGEEIVIRANIQDGINHGIIKFNEIGIHMKAKEKMVNEQLNNVLLSFGITMTMVTKCEYLCDQQIFSFPVHNDIVISYSFKRYPNGQPVMSNDVYHKLRESSSFLSPYAIWKVKITSINTNFDELEKFTNADIDLELSGRGQCIRNDPLLTDICKNQIL